jgi:SAM-dependent methyltransferase
MPKSLVSKDFIFKEDCKGGGLRFLGDFDGLYRADENPWGQDGSDNRMGLYYKYSRENILNVLNSKYSNKKTLIEIGSGLGNVVDLLSTKTPFQCSGSDISSVAISRATKKYQNNKFYCFDIKSKELNVEDFGKYDIVILNQVLWYVLEDIDAVFHNASKLLNDKGVFVISNAFTNEQRYGREVVDGFGGLVQYIQNNQKGKFKLKHASLNEYNSIMYADGIVVLETLNPT